MRTSAVISDEPVISCKTEVNAVKVILLFVLGLKRRFADVTSGQQRNFWSIRHLLHRPKVAVVLSIFPLQEQHALYFFRPWTATISAFLMWAP